tara:strand:+ start:11915 stop:12316 length:402 start_codon:yes stop_codon:yes gene_type:complete
MALLAFVGPLVLIGISAPQADYAEQFQKIAVATSSFQTCEQLGFAVDRQGIVDWIGTAKKNALATGVSEYVAQAELEEAVRFEWQNVLDRHAQALVMQHSPKHVTRNNRLWRSRCGELAKDPWSAPYFLAGQS